LVTFYGYGCVRSRVYTPCVGCGYLPYTLVGCLRYTHGYTRLPLRGCAHTLPHVHVGYALHTHTRWLLLRTVTVGSTRLPVYVAFTVGRLHTLCWRTPHTRWFTRLVVAYTTGRLFAVCLVAVHTVGWFCARSYVDCGLRAVDLVVYVVVDCCC